MTFKKPTDCTQEESELFKNLVLSGGKIDPIGLEARIKKCRLLGFYYSDSNELIGVSAIKQKGKDSVKQFRAKAKLLAGEITTTELGYSVTKAEFRGKGINRKINDKLLEEIKDEKTYATTDNDTMRKYLTQSGFTKKGSSFKATYNNNLDYFEK